MVRESWLHWVAGAEGFAIGPGALTVSELHVSSLATSIIYDVLEIKVAIEDWRFHVLVSVKEIFFLNLNRVIQEWFLWYYFCFMFSGILLLVFGFLIMTKNGFVILNSEFIIWIKFLEVVTVEEGWVFWVDFVQRYWLHNDIFIKILLLLDIVNIILLTLRRSSLNLNQLSIGIILLNWLDVIFTVFDGINFDLECPFKPSLRPGHYLIVGLHEFEAHSLEIVEGQCQQLTTFELIVRDHNRELPPQWLLLHDPVLNIWWELLLKLSANNVSDAEVAPYVEFYILDVLVAW